MVFVASTLTDVANSHSHAFKSGRFALTLLPDSLTIARRQRANIHITRAPMRKTDCAALREIIRPATERTIGLHSLLKIKSRGGYLDSLRFLKKTKKVAFRLVLYGVHHSRPIARALAREMGDATSCGNSQITRKATGASHRNTTSNFLNDYHRYITKLSLFSGTSLKQYDTAPYIFGEILMKGIRYPPQTIFHFVRNYQF